ncbi:MAG: helix-hairpin-helix domain-containing protein [Promethearchaeota archaeon]
MADTEEEFWSIFGERLIEQIEKRKYLLKVLKGLDSFRQKSILLQYIKNKNLVENLLKLLTNDIYKIAEAREYFYSGKLKSKDVSNLFFGFLNLALENNLLVVVIFDEIQYLDEIDPNKVLIKIFTEKFIRLLFEQFSRKKLYIAISCLQNPNKNEWDKLKSHSRNFQSIVEGKEIVLGYLTLDEREEIIKQISDKIGLQEEDRKHFLSKVKGSIDFYLPRSLLRHVANVLDMMEFTAYTEYEIRKLYEKDARAFITPILKEKGFINIEPNEKEIGGYHIDIFATAQTSRATHRKKAFGEVTLMNKSGILDKVEKFANWLNRIKHVEFKPDKGDLAFFICPPDRITKKAKQILEDNNIVLYEYISKNVEEILKISGKIKTQKPLIQDKTELEKDREEIIHIKESKYKLEDIKGIAKTRADLLRKAGITTVKELINCNSKIIAEKIAGIGKTSLDKWKQHARQLLYG